ncbi:MAG: SbcC/MukB-like Walker B domain-containing protein, partial [Cyanobacteria bacterium P01_A01_bin.40]
RLKQLESQLKNIQQQIQATNSQRDSLIREIQTFEDNLDKCYGEQLECQEKVDIAEIDKIEQFAEDNLSRLRCYKLNLETIDRDREKIIEKLAEKLRSKEKNLNESRSTVQIRITNFRGNFRDITLEMGSDFDSLPEYIKLKNRIEQDDLPRHEKRFKEMMTGKVIESIVNFKASLELQEEEITQNIDNLNKSLKEIDYTDSTYIELRYQKSRDREINDFRNSLKTCLGDVTRQTAEDNEERFKNIQKLLIIPFKEKTPWTNKVTDVRNWLDFSVSERDRSNGKDKSYYTDSSGLSGGQKAKLAFTILASTISYQFGLNQTNFSGKSFRFVTIDEAFSKVDDKYACYAMELFKALNLQLLVITPNKQINVLEPYISSLHLVSKEMKEEKSFSSVTSVCIQQFQQNRSLALANNNDKSLPN